MLVFVNMMMIMTMMITMTMIRHRHHHPPSSSSFNDDDNDGDDDDNDDYADDQDDDGGDENEYKARPPTIIRLSKGHKLEPLRLPNFFQKNSIGFRRKCKKRRGSNCHLINLCKHYACKSIYGTLFLWTCIDLQRSFMSRILLKFRF